MKDPQNPGDDGLGPAAKDSSSSRPLVGPESPRRLDVDPDSPMAAVAGIARLSTGTRIAELQAVAGLFLSEVIDRLGCDTGDGGCHHATFTQTVDRFLATREAAEPGADEQPDPWAAAGTGSRPLAKGSTEPNRSGRSDLSATASLPNFPRFRLHWSFNAWAHELAAREDIAELSAVLGSTIDGAYNEIVNALTLVFGLPKFLQRCIDGEFTIEHVLAAARSVKDIAFEYVPRVDDYLENRRADITMETFRKSLNMKIATLVPVDDRLEVAAKRRRVDITTYPDGTASVLLSGPAVELKAFYLRIEAFARAIRKGNIAALTDEDLTGFDVGEQDSIAALMFDIATRATPQMAIAVTTRNTTTGEVSSEEFRLDPADATDPTVPVTAEAVDATAQSARREAEATAATGAEVRTIIKLTMPTHGQWVREQAKMMVTVPYLTAVGASQLPGMFSDGAPVPPDAAAALAGGCSTWYRMLTDPATGTPIDARSKSYYIPADVRAPLIGKWQSCSTPGCTRRAETSEIDHIIPFDHDDPARGGQTTFDNTHPTCRAHHQTKTDRKFSIRMTAEGAVEYAFAHDVVVKSHPPDNPINAEHARQVDSCARNQDPTDRAGSADGAAVAAEAVEAEAAEAVETAETAEADGAVLRFTSESSAEVTGSEDQETRRSRRSRQAQESIWDVCWDPDDPPPF